ncbi:MAG: acetyltransferase [Sulfurimonas sp.]|nr:acetyltransferase [Sulfurimonas sp.]
MKIPVILIGAGGHAKVLIDTLLTLSAVIEGIVDADPLLVGTRVLGVPVLGGDELVNAFAPADCVLVNAIGSVGSTLLRADLFYRFRSLGYHFLTIIHPSATISSDAIVDEGSQVMAGAIIQPGSCIGMNSIVNTKVSIDHDCIIGANVHLAPGVTLSGGVRIGNGVHVGTGAIVIQGVEIGRNSVIGAGSVVLRDVPDEVTVYGVPAHQATNTISS